MAKITKLKEYKPIIGDDNPILTVAYRDVPEGFRFRDLKFRERAPLTLGVKERLCEYCERYYRNYEIVGVTLGDWFNDMQLALDTNLDNFEKFLEVYDQDIAKPVLGREVVNEHDESEITNGTNTQEAKSYDLPVDNGDAQEVTKDTGNSTALGSREVHYRDKQTMSDIGVTNNWEKLNGFLDYNPTLEMTFRNYFKDCFTIYEGIKW